MTDRVPFTSYILSIVMIIMITLSDKMTPKRLLTVKDYKWGPFQERTQLRPELVH